MATRLRITEIFHSIQGESTRAGWPCTFLRLTGCNLRCSWCDSEYTFKGGTWMEVDEIMARVEAEPARLVEITGGEPLLQPSVAVLARRLLARGYEVLCETSGERDISILPEGVARIMDLKAPSSGESERTDWANLERLRPGDEIKIVVADRADFDWALEQLQRHDLLARAPLSMSPAWGRSADGLADWILATGLPIRLNLQLHKILWGEVPGR
ncbi:MAG: radical SAM protein [Myxococcota bacterium]